MLVLATSTLIIAAKNKAAKNVKTNKTSKNGENSKNDEYLEINLI